MIPADWIRLNEKELTPEQVKRLEAGTKVTRISADRYGESVRMEYTVACSGRKKVLVARSPMSMEKIVKQIKANDNCRYAVPKDGVQ